MGWVATWIERIVALIDAPMRMDDGPNRVPGETIGEREMLRRRYGR